MLKSIIKILVIVIVIILIVLAIVLTMGAGLTTIIPFVGLTIGQAILIGIAALAICFIISPEGAAEGMKKAFDGVSSAVSGIVSGVTGVVVDGVAAMGSKLNIFPLVLLIGGGYLGYKMLTDEDQPRVQINTQRELTNDN